MIVLDATVVNVALLVIQDDLGVFVPEPGLGSSNAYLITFGGLLLLAGRLGDLDPAAGADLHYLGLGVPTGGLAVMAGIAEDSQAVRLGRALRSGCRWRADRRR